MASGTVTIRARPLRIGFLVDPFDRQGVLRVIELSSFLWGGIYNPIIPVYKRIPAKWESGGARRLLTPSDIIDGYLDGFDPDFVVPVGTCASRPLKLSNRDIVSVDDLIGNLNDQGATQYGISVVELLSALAHEEFKYERRDGLRVIFPEASRAYRMFLSSVFGVLDREAQQAVDRRLSGVPWVAKVAPVMKLLPELLGQRNIFPTRLNCLFLNRPSREAQIYVCDGASSQDVVDYWNLRAAGYSVLPMPIQIIDEDAARRMACEFVENNHMPHEYIPGMYRRIVVQLSRSVPENAAAKLLHFLKTANVIAKREREPEFMLRSWYPRLWDAFAREQAFEGISFPYAEEQERQISGETGLELRSQDPAFAIAEKFSMYPKFANEFSFRFYAAKEPMAEVLPEGSRAALFCNRSYGISQLAVLEEWSCVFG